MNPGPLTCEASALPLSYVPNRGKMAVRGCIVSWHIELDFLVLKLSIFFCLGTSFLSACRFPEVELDFLERNVFNKKYYHFYTQGMSYGSVA